MNKIETSCPICSHDINIDSGSVPYPGNNRRYGDNRFFSNIVFCNKCGLGIAFPAIPKDKMEEFYERGTFWKQLRPADFSLKAFPVPFALAKSRWGNIENALIQSGNLGDLRVLDIGAGYGCLGFAGSQSRKAWIALYTCVEPDFAMRQFLENDWIGSANVGRLDVKTSLDEVHGQFDVVVLSHVLEHLRNPSSLLKSAISLTAPNGILLIDLPNQDYLFKASVFPHVLFFSFAATRYMLDKEGSIRIISIEGRGSNKVISPLNKRPPINVKVINRLIKETHKYHKFLPTKFLVAFFTWYFGIDHIDSEGTWIRALCRKKAIKKDII